MNSFLEILKIILPLGIIGGFVVLLIRIIKRKKDKSNEEKTDYMEEGLSLGMIFGAALASIFAREKIGTFAAFGMVLGMAIGSAIRRKK